MILPSAAPDIARSTAIQVVTHDDALRYSSERCGTAHSGVQGSGGGVGALTVCFRYLEFAAPRQRQ